MSSQKYRYGHRPGRHRTRKIVLILIVALLLVIGIVALILMDLRKNRAGVVEGKSHTVVQANTGLSQYLTIDEPFFSFELPTDWKETERVNTIRQHSISWQATKKKEDNRYLTLYVDIIPTDVPINRLLPVTAQGNALTFTDISDNCVTFTGGEAGTAGETTVSRPGSAKWQGVDFNCSLYRAIDNQVGTGSKDGINTITVTGPEKGTHRYFFLYSDRNIQPDYNIIYDILNSFRAK